jgi:hypothetical protein
MVKCKRRVSIAYSICGTRSLVRQFSNPIFAMPLASPPPAIDILLPCSRVLHDVYKSKKAKIVPVGIEPTTFSAVLKPF